MPAQAANLTAIRTPGHYLRCFLTVIKGNLVLSASVNMASVTYPATDIVIDTITSGSAANVTGGMTVMIFRSNGTDLKGVTRVRYSGTISSTNIPVRELSRGTISVSDNDILKIYDDIRLSDKLVEASSDFDPDGVAYSDQGSNPPPVACSGGAWAGWDTMLPITMAGSDSYNIDPDSGASFTHVWTLPSGLSFSSGTSTSANPGITGSAGEYEVAHAVTDSSNSKSVTQYVPIRIHTSADPPYDCIVQSLEGDPTNGWSATVRVFAPSGSTLSIANLPDDCLAILWKEEYIAGTLQSFGSDVATRSHILMTGYLRRENVEATTEGVEYLDFEMISPLARLSELVGYSKVMLDNATPDVWSEVKTLGVQRAIVQLVQFYTNLVEAGFDFKFNATYYTDYDYPAFYLQRSTPFQQIQELADGVDARLVCRRHGRFEVQTVPRFIANGSRASVPVTLTLEDDDVIDWRYARSHWRPVNVVECRGFTDGAAGNQPIFSRWVGLAPGLGNDSTIVERLIADTQSDLNDRCGRRGADKDGVYVDSNLKFQEALELDVTLYGSYDVFDFYAEYVLLNWTTLRRVIALSTHYFEVMGISGEFRDGTGRVHLRLRSATHGQNGETYTPPNESQNTLPDFDPPDVDFPDTGVEPVAPTSNEGTNLYSGTQRIAFFTSGYIFKTTTFGAGAGTLWTAYDASLAPYSVSGTLLTWIPDGFNPGKGWLNTNTGIYYIDLVANTATLKHTFGTSGNFWGGDASFAQANHVCWSDGKRVVYTTDNTTFTLVSPGSGGIPSNTGTVNEIVGVYYSSHQANTVVVGFFDAANTAHGYRSTDGGANWTSLSDPFIDSGQQAIGGLHFPWNNNSDDGLCYYMALTAGGTSHLYRSSSTSATDISPRGAGGITSTAYYARGGIATYVGNRNLLGVVDRNANEFYLSEDGGDNWTLLNDGDWEMVFIAGDTPNTMYFINKSTRTIGLSTNRGVTIVDQTGDISVGTNGFALAGW